MNTYKTYYKGNIKHDEYYHLDGTLNMYTLTEKTADYKLTRCFDKKGILIEEIKVFYNKNGVPCRITEWVSNVQGDGFSDNFIPIFSGFEDASKMSLDDKKKHNNLIANYLVRINRESKEVPW